MTRFKPLCRAALLLAVAGLAAGMPAFPGQESKIAELHRAFADPPDSSRIMMRWWWFGPAATKPELTRELEQMKAAGIGGVEIANLYPLALDNPSTGFQNTPFLSLGHLESLQFAVQEAWRLGLRVDITLGSGWPFGGPHIPITEAAGKLRVESHTVEPNATAAQAPFIDTGEELLPAFLLPDPPAEEDVKYGQPLAPPVAGWYSFPAAPAARKLICFVSSRTGMMVKRPSVGAAGFVLDHYDHVATEHHLKEVGDRLLSTFGDQPPYAVFSDSLEDYGSNWSPALLQEFERRRGYDLRPHLLALVMDAGEDTAAIRHDWGRTLTEMADENFLVPMQAWAKQHGTQLRSQTYGFPPVTLSSNKLADLPEGEGKATFNMWREFSDTRWAASAGHLFGRPVISSETWTWLHSPAFRATPLDMKAEADLHFLQGINQLVGHGWPYSPESAGEPGWRMYAAAALDDHNPWFFAMPDLARYLQRVSFALRQGEPANDVAVLLPNDDVWASFSAEFQKPAPAEFHESDTNASMDESMDKFLGKQVIAQVLDAGFNLDFIDVDAIGNVGIPYKILILPAVDRLPVAVFERIRAFARHGGIVVATRRTPATAPGLVHATEDSTRLKEISQALFHIGLPGGYFIEDESTLGAALKSYTAPDIKLSPPTPEIGFTHRKLPAGNLYFIANTSNEPKHVQAQFRDSALHAEMWDALTGEITGLDDSKKIDLDLEPYESRLIFFSDEAMTGTPKPEQRESVEIDLSRQWKVKFGDSGLSADMDQLASWSDDAKTQFFSGLATYKKTFMVKKEVDPQGAKFFIDFGAGSKITLPSPPGEHNMRAYLDPPIREAAQVSLNGKLIGILWHPPYRVEVTKYLHKGPNELSIVVGNTAMNSLAGQPQPDYRLLWDRYGKLFTPQDMDDLHPVPSGILGPVKLIKSTAVSQETPLKRLLELPRLRIHADHL
jgi:hypothetical protein